MNELQNVFNYAGLEIRTVTKEGQPWFVAKDVSDVLGFRMASDMARSLDEDEKGTHTIQTHGGNQSLTVISESGLYSAILKSRKPEARQFKRWITHEVLPAIRKTGGYVANDELFVDTYLPFADEQTKLLFSATLETVRKQNDLITTMKPKVEQHDRFMAAVNAQNLDSVAKSLGVGRNKLIAFLRAVGVFTKRGRPLPKQQHINEGYFEVKQSTSAFGYHNSSQTYVTAKGIERIDKALEHYGGANKLNAMKVSEIEKIKL
ncbi:BRO family protein [Bacillus sp. LL01]|uniref:BRO family protein n=1 Tax=Bacillus sp. LL01 TaxID=1665556 RepID=UPI0009E4E0FF|nr:BRO family protein [Bacillus sp. LL01]